MKQLTAAGASSRKRYRRTDSSVGSNAKELMSHQIPPTMEQEYTELLAYLDFYSTYVSGVDPLDPIHPANVMKEIVEKFGHAEALEGLKQAINDTVEDLICQPPEYVEKLDGALRARGIITFSEVRLHYESAYRQILKRGSIENETEYDLIASIVAAHSPAVDENDRSLMAELMARYEKDS